MIPRSRGHHSLFSPELRGDEDTMPQIERKTAFHRMETFQTPGLARKFGNLSMRPCSTDSSESEGEGEEEKALMGESVVDEEEEGCDVTRTAAKLGHAVKELKDTEAVYMRRLELVQELFVAPLRQRAPSVLPLVAIHDIFQNLEPILVVGRNFLASIHEHGINGGPETLALFTCMKEAYGEYASKFSSCSTALAAALRTTPAFGAFKQDAETRLAESLGIRLGLSSLLLEPIQRVPRYELLLKQIIKYTDEAREPSRYAQAMRCLDLAHEIALHVNRSSSHEEVEILHKAEARLQGPLAHIALGCSGAPLDEGFFKVKTIGSLAKVSLDAIRAFGDAEKRWCILFEEVLVVARRVPRTEGRGFGGDHGGDDSDEASSETFTCEHLLFLRDLCILQVDDNIISLRRKHGPTEPLLFLRTETPEASAAWLAKLRKSSLKNIKW